MSPRPPTLSLTLLGSFSLRNGERELHPSAVAERLISMLAVETTPQQRSRVAGTIWPEVSEQRAAANLRTALWRLSTLNAASIVVAERDRLRLAGHVVVDLHECRHFIKAIRQGRAVPTRALSLLAVDLLPDCAEDWATFAREQHRQLRLHALEELCRRATLHGLYDRAIEAGLLAVGCEPLRESSHAGVIKAHLAEGNIVEARRQLESYRKALADAGLGFIGVGGLEELMRRRP